MEEFYDKQYVLTNNENYNELLKYLGIGYLQRQVALTLKPVQYVSCNNDGTFSLHFTCTLIDYVLQFTPDEEFEETKPYGAKVQALLSIEGNKIYHRQVESNGRTLNHVYEFHNDEMILTTTSPGLDPVVKRHYVAVASQRNEDT